MKRHLCNYPTYAFLNYFWNFGSLIFLFFLLQIISGFYLAMYYVAYAQLASALIEWILREVYSGWFFKYVHSNGASFIFLFIYMHILRNLYYGLFKDILLWWSGVILLILMILTAFFGYILPWGQMSFWAATVITNFLTVIPEIGIKILEWFWCGFALNTWTLTRFYSFHYFCPFVIFGLIFLHIFLLHKKGSNNSLSLINFLQMINFFPFFWIKDSFSFICSCFPFFFIVFYYPNYLGHPDNYIEANDLLTPLHIVPEWYFLFYYAMLRIIPHKTYGIILVALYFILFFSLPMLNQGNFSFNQNLYFYFVKKTQAKLYSLRDFWRVLHTLTLDKYDKILSGIISLFWRIANFNQLNIFNNGFNLKSLQFWTDFNPFHYLVIAFIILINLGGSLLTPHVITIGFLATVLLFICLGFIGGLTNFRLIWAKIKVQL